jgi:2-amino-4-hydroxy-6-hydroxymethyldihydropteridine diphosphokinase
VSVERVFVAIGSNVEPDKNVRRALNALQEAFGAVRLSTLYRNRAVGFEGDDFLNAVIEFSMEVDVASLLSTLHQIEAQCGRRRDDPKWAPRRMDLDVLKIGQWVGEWPGLILPRPDLTVKPYMLGPFAELAGDWVDPHSQQTYQTLWEHLKPLHPLTPTTLSV